MTMNIHIGNIGATEQRLAGYAAIAEVAKPVSVTCAMARLLRIRADLLDPDVHASDAAVSGLLVEEERVLTEIALKPAATAAELQMKLDLLTNTLAETNTSQMAQVLASAVARDFRMLDPA
ncbi:hypothetical protein [Breoghania sp.]|uniref:hypothetical protein n=1 Tax=Breoghania sp. TaxID=2065378 RepID=UPI002AA73B46|nr:hypothetical protein [Breoghania sp.]